MQFEIDKENDKAKDPLPTCKICGKVARPNMLMFYDSNWVGDRYARFLFPPPFVFWS